MPHIVVSEDRCKGCGLCTTVCSRKLVVLSEIPNALGYKIATAVEQSKCTGCTLCAQICPDVAITVYKEDGDI